MLDRHDVVVDGLGEADDGELVAVGFEIGGEVCGRGVGVVAADRVKNGDAVAGQAFRGHAQRILAFLHQAALDAVGGVGQLDAAVPDRRAAMIMQEMRLSRISLVIWMLSPRSTP